MEMLAMTDSLKHTTVELVPAMNTFKIAPFMFLIVFRQNTVSVLYTYS